MSLVKLRSTKGADIWVNPDQVALLSPLPTINQCGIMLPMGLNLEIDENIRDVAEKFGWRENLAL
jgi:hypothetical protein